MDFNHYRVDVYKYCQHTFMFKQHVKVNFASDDPFKGAECEFEWHLVVRLRIAHREATVADTGQICRHLRQQRMRFLYKGKLRNYIYLIIQ